MKRLGHPHSIIALTRPGFTTRAPKVGVGASRSVFFRPSFVLCCSTSPFRDHNLRTMLMRVLQLLECRNNGRAGWPRATTGLHDQPCKEPSCPITLRGSIERYQDEAPSFFGTRGRATTIILSCASSTCQQAVPGQRTNLAGPLIAMEVHSSWETTSTPVAPRSILIPTLVHSGPRELCEVGTPLTIHR